MSHDTDIIPIPPEGPLSKGVVQPYGDMTPDLTQKVRGKTLQYVTSFLKMVHPYLVLHM